ncbi:hypothetical protein FS837_000911 [Tulasnella sp. UAMH 9824]|nr:hypothetical protein FS837_000911 [Tulasnella sp. UAMH 9824]
MRQVAARRHHNKKRAEGFIPNDHGQDNNNDNTGDTPVGGNNGSSSAAVTTTTTTAQSSSSVVRTTTTTTTTTPPAQTTTTTTPSTTTTTTTTSSSSSVVVVPSTTSTPVVLATASVNNIKDEFDRSEFVRNSVAIHDDYNEKPAMSAMALARGGNNMDEPSATPRPPSMFERRGQAQPTYGVGETMNTGYYGQQDQYYNNYGNNGYYNQDQYGAGYDHQQQYGPADHQQQYGAPDHPYVAGGAYGYTPPNEYQQSQLTRKPSAPLGAARGPGSEYQQQQQGHDHVASPAESAQYDARHQSVTPFQQQQYNDINKALNGGVTPVSENPPAGRELPTAYSTLNQPQQPAHGNAAASNAHQQAANNRKSLYDDEDAYGGI